MRFKFILVLLILSIVLSGCSPNLADGQIPIENKTCAIPTSPKPEPTAAKAVKHELKVSPVTATPTAEPGIMEAYTYNTETPATSDYSTFTGDWSGKKDSMLLNVDKHGNVDGSYYTVIRDRVPDVLILGKIKNNILKTNLYYDGDSDKIDKDDIAGTIQLIFSDSQILKSTVKLSKRCIELFDLPEGEMSFTKYYFKKVKNDNANKQLVLPCSDEDFIIEDGNYCIKAGINIKDFKTNEKIKQFLPCDFNKRRYYDVYTYKNYKIVVDQAFRDDPIYEIELTTPALQTSRGIKVGDPISKVLEKYGDAECLIRKNKPESYDYYHEYNNISFYVNEQGKVSRIKIM